MADRLILNFNLVIEFELHFGRQREKRYRKRSCVHDHDAFFTRRGLRFYVSAKKIWVLIEMAAAFIETVIL